MSSDKTSPSRSGRYGRYATVRWLLAQGCARSAVLGTVAEHALGGAAVLSANVLGSHPAVKAVYARGSYGRGSSVPFMSDLDLGVVLERPSPASAYETIVSLYRRYRYAKRVNPLIRDRPCVMLTEREWTLFSSYWYLHDIHQWTPLGGRAKPRKLSPEAPIEPGLFLGSRWYESYRWTLAAYRSAMSPDIPTHKFSAVEKKSKRYLKQLFGWLNAKDPAAATAAFLSTSTPEIPRWAQLQAAPNDGALASLAALLVELGDAAVRVREAAPNAAEPAQRVPVIAIRTPIDEQMLAALSRAFDLETSFDTVLWVGEQVFLVPARRLDTRDTLHALLRVQDVERRTGAKIVLVTADVLALAPPTSDARVLHRRTGLPPLERVTALLREQLFHAAMTTAVQHRSSLAYDDPTGELRFVRSQILKALVYFRTGAVPLTRSDLLRGVEQLEGLDDASRALCLRLLGPPGEVPAIAAPEAFRLNTILLELLFETLEALQFPRS